MSEFEALIRTAEQAKGEPVRACATCKYVVSPRSQLANCRYVVSPRSQLATCSATGSFTSTERHSSGPCGPEGKMWEPRPPRQRGVFERAWRWMFGGRS